jgi:carboxymethylenebutenolidase
MIEFARPDGGKTKGYLATAGQGRPGIVVIQEWWGLNDQICGVADRFACAGYNALAPISIRDASPQSRTRPII